MPSFVKVGLGNFDVWTTFIPVRTTYIDCLTKVGVNMPEYNADEQL
jgi:hypothetical protein